MTKESLTAKFQLQVFINCPFDKNYRPLFHALVFTVHLLGFRPRCSQEIAAGGNRLQRIINIIRGCKFGIHDISRIQRTGRLPRFNMPFELGIDLGCKEAGNTQLQSKNLLILEADGYRYQRFISDLSGWDVAAHHNKVTEVITRVRNWLNDVNESPRPLPSGELVYAEYRKFRRTLPQILKHSELHGSVSDITYTDYSYLAAKFIKERHERQSY